MAVQVFIQLPTGDDLTDVQSAKLEISRKLGGVDVPETVTVEPATEAGPFLADLDSSFSCTLSYVDDAGNASVTPSTITFQVDNIPPADPGAISFRLGDTVPDPAPEA